MDALDLSIIAAVLQVSGGMAASARPRLGNGLTYAGLLCWLGAYLWWLFG